MAPSAYIILLLQELLKQAKNIKKMFTYALQSAALSHKIYECISEITAEVC